MDMTINNEITALLRLEMWRSVSIILYRSRQLKNAISDWSDSKTTREVWNINVPFSCSKNTSYWNKTLPPFLASIGDETDSLNTVINKSKE
jgi:hypothetical protein